MFLRKCFDSFLKEFLFEMMIFAKINCRCKISVYHCLSDYSLIDSLWCTVPWMMYGALPEYFTMRLSDIFLVYCNVWYVYCFFMFRRLND
jgi:hypothetical protein